MGTGGKGVAYGQTCDIVAVKGGIFFGGKGCDQRRHQDGKIPGLMDIYVQTDCLKSSNADVMLDSLFQDLDALKGYSVHPEHVKVADGNVRPYTRARICMDFEVE